MSNLGTSGITPLRDPVNGVRATTPPQLFVNRQRRPSATGTDYQNYDLGCYWLYWPTASPNTQEVWQLVSLQQVNNAPFGKWVLVTSGFGSLVTLTGDTGGPVPPTNGNIDTIGGASTGNPTTNINTRGIPGTSTMEFCLNNSINQPLTNADQSEGMYSLGSNRFMHNYGTNNTFLGSFSGNTTLTVPSAVSNTCIGYQNGMSLTTGSDNTNVGWANGSLITTGQFNSGIGAGAFASLTTGTFNNALGNQAFSDVGSGLVSGSNNIGIGANAGSNFTSNESDNILLNNDGVVADQNTLRIGQSSGTGQQQLDASYIHGIYQRDVNATNLPVIVDLNGKLGTQIGGIPFYEEGVWTPVLSFGGASVGIVYTVQSANYIKIGKCIFINWNIALSSQGVSVGTAIISGLPYAVSATSLPRYGGYFAIANGINTTVGYDDLHCEWLNGTSTLRINQTSFTGAAFISLDDTNFTNTSSIGGGGFYFID